jgi:protein SCO1/2
MTTGRSKGAAIWVLLGLGLVVLTVGVLILRARLQSEPLPLLGETGAFALTNQLGQPISAEELRGSIWVGDIIFTRCPGPCLLMTRSLSAVQSRLPADAKVLLVSLSADPEHDTPEVLRSYGERFEADPRRWHFLTGGKAELYRFALDDLKLAAEEIDPAQRENLNDLYVHSTRLVLVDGKGRVRGYFDGTDAGVPERLLASIRRLQREE